MLGLVPHTVNPENYEINGLSIHRADHLTYAGIKSDMLFWEANYPNVYHGSAPVGCSESIGRAYVKFCTQMLAKSFKVLKEDEECIKMMQRT